PMGTMATPSAARSRPRRAASVWRATWSLVPSTSTTVRPSTPAPSVTEVAAAGVEHGDAGRGRGRGDLGVADAAAGLGDGAEGGRGRGRGAVGEGEEGVAAGGGALGAVAGLRHGD